MEIRRYRSSDVEEVVRLFRDTVHTVNVADHTAEQLDAWAPSDIDIGEWDRSLSAHFSVVATENGKLLGFVMVNEYLQKFSDGHSIAEFMVLPKYRRCGIGKKAAVWCFEAYRGNWEVQPSYGSEKAYQFWKSVIEEYTDGECRFEDGIFLFQN